MNNSFYQIISATSKEDLEDIEFPCTIIVWRDTEEAREEGIDLVFKDIRKYYTNYIPWLIGIGIWVICVLLLIYYWMQ